MLQSDAHTRQKFFAHDLAVLHGVNTDFRHFLSFLGLFFSDVSVVLHDESIMGDKWFACFEAVNLHRVDPPIDLTAHRFFSATLRCSRFHTRDIIILKRIERFVPRLFTS